MLLVVWLLPGLHRYEAVFGMAHGLGWIAMSLACIAALRLRVIDLRLAVAVAVLGGDRPVHRVARVRARQSPQRGPPSGRARRDRRLATAPRTRAIQANPGALIPDF